MKFLSLYHLSSLLILGLLKGGGSLPSSLCWESSHGEGASAWEEKMLALSL